LDILETGSVDLLASRGILAAGRTLAGQGTQQAAPLVDRRQVVAVAEPGDELADLILCLSGTQANGSGWHVFAGKFVEYPQFREEW
jgi:hypothetical protein